MSTKEENGKKAPIKMPWAHSSYDLAVYLLMIIYLIVYTFGIITFGFALQFFSFYIIELVMVLTILLGIKKTVTHLKQGEIWDWAAFFVNVRIKEDYPPEKIHIWLVVGFLFSCQFILFTSMRINWAFFPIQVWWAILIVSSVSIFIYIGLSYNQLGKEKEQKVTEKGEK